MRGLVEDDLAARDGAADGVLVGDRTLDEGGVGVDVRRESRAEIVEHDDVVAAGDERVDEVGADEPRTSGHERPHRSEAIRAWIT